MKKLTATLAIIVAASTTLGIGTGIHLGTTMGFRTPCSTCNSKSTVHFFPGFRQEGEIYAKPTPRLSLGPIFSVSLIDQTRYVILEAAFKARFSPIIHASPRDFFTELALGYTRLSYGSSRFIGGEAAVYDERAPFVLIGVGSSFAKIDASQIELRLGSSISYEKRTKASDERIVVPRLYFTVGFNTYFPSQR